MRIFVSSSFQDLQDYRLAAIRVLRQLGHEVVAMEDFVAASEVPLKQMLDKVDRCELYVGLFAWRYGFVPKNGVDNPISEIDGAEYGITSITHYEYLYAKHKKIDCLAFLLDEHVPWPPHLIDGFSTLEPNAPKNAKAIRALRSELQLNAVVSYFSNPNDLEARVSAAVTVAGMSKQVRLNLSVVQEAFHKLEDSNPEMSIRGTILNAHLNQVLMIDLSKTDWWSTRLYLVAALAERLTHVRRILIVAEDNEFVGLLSTQWSISTLAAKHPTLAEIDKKLQQRDTMLPDVDAEIKAVFALWKEAFGGSDPKKQEENIKVVLTVDLLRRWFGEAMLQQPVHVLDLSRATVIDLLRILDYPSEFVPVATRRKVPTELEKGEGELIQVVDKSALNAQLAQSYVTELMDRARIT